MKGFASDNYAGALPEVMQALQKANVEHARSYGSDEITQRVEELLSKELERDLRCLFVFNGTGANVLSLSLCTQSFHAVLCSDIAHIYADESSAPETHTGCRIFPLETDKNGKITVEAIKKRMHRSGDKHYAQPAVVSITQATEYGTVYTIDEINAIAEYCGLNHLYLHIDGARLFNAQAALGCGLKELIGKADVVSFGGTKAGMLYGECVVILNNKLKEYADYKHKLCMQLPSKARFIAAQFEALLQYNHGVNAAYHANTMGQLLSKGLHQISPIHISRPTEANTVFAILPHDWIAILQEDYPFYEWDESNNEVRLMCSWDTKEEEVTGFLSACKNLANLL